MDLADGGFGECERVDGVDLDSVQQEMLAVVVDGEVEEDIFRAALDPDDIVISLFLDRLLLGRGEGASRAVDLDSLGFRVESESESTASRVGDLADAGRQKEGICAD